jgi:hypothetical protein
MSPTGCGASSPESGATTDAADPLRAQILDIPRGSAKPGLVEHSSTVLPTGRFTNVMDQTMLPTGRYFA